VPQRLTNNDPNARSRTGRFSLRSCRTVRAADTAEMKVLGPVTLIAGTLVMTCLSLQLFHELGHALHASISGGTVVALHLPPLGFSRTVVDPNPSPIFVILGGFLWGCLIAAGIVAVAAALRQRRWLSIAWFVLGACLVTNGAYLAFGGFISDGDTADLIRLGVPQWPLLCAGLPLLVAGLWCWNGLGTSFGIGKGATVIDRHLTLGVWLAVAILLVAEYLASAWG